MLSLHHFKAHILRMGHISENISRQHVHIFKLDIGEMCGNNIRN